MSSPPEVSSAPTNFPTSTSTANETTTVSAANETNTTSTANESSHCNEREENQLEGSEPSNSKRQKTSSVWLEFREVDGVDGKKKAQCIHCNIKLSILASKTTTGFQRHLKICTKRKIFQKQQQKISLQPIPGDSRFVTPALTDGKFDMRKMREAMAQWILMHEHPFAIVEEEGFNMMQKRGMPEWGKISRNTIKLDCMKVYEAEKNKLMLYLKTVNKISVTTDMWRSTNQKIEYMVLTGHFIDSNWKLQKRVLNFVHLPPPHRGVEIADNLFKCMKDWGIENKVFTLSADNASNNDSAIRILTSTFSRNKNLLCGGKLFHVRCCAHILNLMVQDGLSEITTIISDIHDSVLFINYNEARRRDFSEIVQQLNIVDRKLILECKTRWNSTYEMLSTAIKFKDAFPMYKEREPRYTCCPSIEDWIKVEKVCSILEVFNSATHIISGSEYPTSNLFLNEVYRIKVVLDKTYLNATEDVFLYDMVKAMKLKFDKYWGECNLLMSIAAILDPRCKMRVIDFCFPKMYDRDEARENIAKVKEALYELYDEYVAEIYSNDSAQCEYLGSVNNNTSNQASDTCSGWSEFSEFVKSIETSQPQNSDLDNYLAEGCYICQGQFDALEWWRVNSLKYRTLSIMARDILAIPVSTVASEATFSAGSRVIDTYRASLSTDTVEALICGEDWCRSLHGVKRKNKVNKTVEVMLLNP